MLTATWRRTRTEKRMYVGTNRGVLNIDSEIFKAPPSPRNHCRVRNCLAWITSKANNNSHCKTWCLTSTFVRTHHRGTARSVFGAAANFAREANAIRCLCKPKLNLVESTFYRKISSGGPLSLTPHFRAPERHMHAAKTKCSFVGVHWRSRPRKAQHCGVNAAES